MELSPNFKKMMGMVEGMKTLPESAANKYQKPVDNFGWKPSDAQTAQDIANAKALEPLEREAFMQARAEQLKEETPTQPVVEDRSSLLDQARSSIEKLGKFTREEFQDILKNYEDLKVDLTWTPMPSGEDVWEEGKKNGKKIQEDMKNKQKE